MNISFSRTYVTVCPPLSAFYHATFDHNNQDEFVVIFIVINVVLSLASTVSNFIVIFTICKTPSLQTPANILILNLAFSDFGVGSLCQPSYCIFRYSQTTWNIPVLCPSFKVFSATAWFLSCVSFLTLLAITTDRFLAIRLHLRYQEFVTIRRYCVVLVVILACSSVVGCGRMLLASTTASALVTFLACFMSFLVTIDVYLLIRIYRVIRRHSAQIHAQQQSTEQNINMPRYKKSVNTMYYVIGAFVLCYVPFIITLAVQDNEDTSLQVKYVQIAAETLVMANGVANPIIYFWRIREIRVAVRTVLKI